MDNQKYVVLTTILKQKKMTVGADEKSVEELTEVINQQANKGYKLHTLSSTVMGNVTTLGGTPVQVIMVFEKIS